jgi:hypothetical protein
MGDAKFEGLLTAPAPSVQTGVDNEPGGAKQGGRLSPVQPDGGRGATNASGTGLASTASAQAIASSTSGATGNRPLACPVRTGRQVA